MAETKNAAELYPSYMKDQEECGSFYGPSDYQPIIDSFGEVLIQVDDDDYQGDTRVMYQKDGRFGLLIFGWGSCSGCDSLQACGSLSEIDSLIESLHNDIKWFNSLADLKKYVEEKDWELDFAWHAEGTRSFVQQVKDFAPNT